MTTIDKLRRVKKGDRLSASQHNLIVDRIRGGQGLTPNSFESGGKVYVRNKGFPSSKLKRFHVFYSIIENDGTTITIFDSSDDSQLEEGEVAVFRRNGIQVAHEAGEGPNNFSVWFNEGSLDLDLGDVSFSSSNHWAMDEVAFSIIKDGADTQKLKCTLDTTGGGKFWAFAVQWEIWSSNDVTQILDVFGEASTVPVIAVPTADSDKINVCPTSFFNFWALDGGYQHFGEIVTLPSTTTPRYYWGFINQDEGGSNPNPIIIDDAHKFQVYNDGGIGGPPNVTNFMCTYFNDVIKTDSRYPANP